MEGYFKAVDLIDYCVQDFIESLEHPRTALEVFNKLKNIQKEIHPKMEEVRVWYSIYKSMVGDRLGSPDIHPKNKPWVFEYLRQLSYNKTVL